MEEETLKKEVKVGQTKDPGKGEVKRRGEALKQAVKVGQTKGSRKG